MKKTKTISELIMEYFMNHPKEDIPHGPVVDYIKKAILERDGYHCVVCGRGREDGVELVVDHIKPKDKGGTNDIDNGQTLCMEHNLMKKNYSQTEAGKRYFIKIYEKAVANNDERMIKFCKAVFDAYNDFEINVHISRPN
ncbi:MAG: HNH endonuclease [Methanosarcinales archaeon]